MYRSDVLSQGIEEEEGEEDESLCFVISHKLYFISVLLCISARSRREVLRVRFVEDVVYLYCYTMLFISCRPVIH